MYVCTVPLNEVQFVNNTNLRKERERERELVRENRGSWLTADSKNSPPPTIMAEMAVPSTAKMTMEPMFLKKFPCSPQNKSFNF